LEKKQHSGRKKGDALSSAKKPIREVVVLEKQHNRKKKGEVYRESSLFARRNDA